MSYNRDMINASRTVLSYKIELVNELLDELELELDKAKANNVEPYILAKATKRLKLLDELINTIVIYDSYVQKYLAFNPEDTSYLKDRLEVAKKYVHALGGDWGSVVWGKRTDY
jgi:hypothetical protein